MAITMSRESLIIKRQLLEIPSNVNKTDRKSRPDMIKNVLNPLFSGVGGSLILGIFCSTFMITNKVIAIMPLFIAFNSAMTGYKIVENINNQVETLHLLTFIFGVAGGALTFATVIS